MLKQDGKRASIETIFHDPWFHLLDGFRSFFLEFCPLWGYLSVQQGIEPIIKIQKPRKCILIYAVCQMDLCRHIKNSTIYWREICWLSTGELKLAQIQCSKLLQIVLNCFKFTKSLIDFCMRKIGTNSLILGGSP